MDSVSDQTTPEYKKQSTFKKKLYNFFAEVYKIHLFIVRFFKEAFMPPFEFKEVIRQCYEVGVRSFTLITVTGFIVGLIFTKQSRPSLITFGATSWLPSLVSIAIMRALAPLVTALIASGKVGSSIGAELGSMRVTEQIDAMEVSGTKPFKFLVCTRVLATTITIPILATYTGFIGLLGGYLNVAMNEGTSYTTFMQQVFQPLVYLDFTASLIKSIVFGFTIGIVGCYQGYYSNKGTEGVGKAANGAVVTAMFLVFIEEIIIVQIASNFR
ncbi:phospholipid/cholesterol/gamma-HCH transport system permease protein [Mucilaginibacter frigoritolerans]|jgi:phospholipid/cholesterol/gamma-HCH transport system permease protein|uniref:Phospholipid/cholesterol/gamma-HCH transport system permease protein n=1 Tax=Mucilaginibacter frigoritolerans TaxID=652788 RepID=A0A562U974_9SPHI|nr:ABC transporter permease [Mucilaginibacter frigoritolerans]TWJ02350.1 phospholipid/cholesterol/gamma-HCH transport system permease protein [Mucilaginibacter frigoritolerans]